MNFSTILSLGSLFVSVESKIKSGQDGKTAIVNTPGSINGHKGQFVAGFVADDDLSAGTALQALEGVSLDL